MSKTVIEMLTDAIEDWMKAEPGGDERYAHGNAQGIARAIAAMRGTSFTEEWEAGLDRYQNRVVVGRGEL